MNVNLICSGHALSYKCSMLSLQGSTETKETIFQINIT